MSDSEKIELLKKYHENRHGIIMERHRRAFDYMNGLYQRVLNRSRRLKKELAECKRENERLRNMPCEDCKENARRMTS